MKRIGFSLLLFLFGNIALAQDSLYYSVLWTPKTIYKEASVVQESVFAFQFGEKGFSDSTLIQRTFYDTLGQIVKQENYTSEGLTSRVQNFYSYKFLDSSYDNRYSANSITRSYYRYDEKANLLTLRQIITPGDDVSWRYVYNNSNQLTALYKQTGERKEYLAAFYTYQSNRLVKQIKYYNDNEKEDFSYLYHYKIEKEINTATRFIQSPRSSPLVNSIREYNKKNQLCRREQTTSEMGTTNTGDFSLRSRIVEEIFIYLTNGLLKEKIVKRNGEPVRLEKHFYR